MLHRGRCIQTLRALKDLSLTRDAKSCVMGHARGAKQVDARMDAREARLF